MAKRVRNHRFSTGLLSPNISGRQPLCHNLTLRAQRFGRCGGTLRAQRFGRCGGKGSQSPRHSLPAGSQHVRRIHSPPPHLTFMPSQSFIFSQPNRFCTFRNVGDKVFDVLQSFAASSGVCQVCASQVHNRRVRFPDFVHNVLDVVTKRFASPHYPGLTSKDLRCL